MAAPLASMSSSVNARLTLTGAVFMLGGPFLLVNGITTPGHTRDATFGQEIQKVVDLYPPIA